MVHHRINEKQSNPNPHVNFITVLRTADPQDEEGARHLLRALAAQVKPVMKSHGFETNSLEEYEYNSVFAGRNWNAGETIEIVLRRANGNFYPRGWLMSTLCHELAHIKHMNHGPGFQKLWAQLRAEVRQLQDKGYYGDGYWSSGMRLEDSVYILGDAELQPEDMPEYMCGGAQTKARPPRRKRRRPAVFAGPSLHTGRQTEKRRKVGSRVNADNFLGTGTALNEGDNSGKGTGFRKQAASNKAREERALAAEKRLRTLQGQIPGEGSGSGEYEDDLDEKETDEERRQTLMDSFLTKEESIDMKIKLEDLIKFEDDFRFEAEDSFKNEPGCDLPSSSGSTFTTNNSKRKYKAEHDDHGIMPKRKGVKREPEPINNGSPHKSEGWNCLVCTLINESGHLACSVCATPKGETLLLNTSNPSIS